MKPEDFKVWRTSRDWTQQQAADALGVTRRSVIAWEDGTHPIKRHIALAMAAISAGLEPWSGSGA